MEKKEYLSEERYQKNKKRIVAGAIVVLIIGLLLGGSLIAIGLSKQSKVNANYSEANKESLSKKLEIEKQSLISSKEKIEEEIKPVEDEIKSLEREKFTGFDDAYYQRQDRIEELEKSINESKKNISAIETALGDSMSACTFDTTANNSYTKKRKSVEGIKFYRNNYQRRLMQAKRSDDEQIKLSFENWKQLAKSKIKEFNNKEISEDELLEWMKENKNI